VHNIIAPDQCVTQITIFRLRLTHSAHKLSSSPSSSLPPLGFLSHHLRCDLSSVDSQAARAHPSAEKSVHLDLIQLIFNITRLSVSLRNYYQYLQRDTEPTRINSQNMNSHHMTANCWHFPHS